MMEKPTQKLLSFLGRYTYAASSAVHESSGMNLALPFINIYFLLILLI
jgi:hypothetical protein